MKSGRIEYDNDLDTKNLAILEQIIVNVIIFVQQFWGKFLISATK